MMKAFSFLTILESLSKKLSILRTKMHSDDLRVNHGTITSQLRVSRPFSHCASRRVSHFAAILTILFTVGVGNVWGVDFNVDIDQIRVLPTRSAFVQISAGSNVTTSSGKLSIAKSKTGTFTIASTIPATYKIKSIAISVSRDVTEFTCTNGGTLSGSNKSWTFTPTGETPVGSASFSLNNTSSGAANMTFVVTMTTAEAITVEELKTFKYSDPNFSFTSSVATSQVTIQNKANASASSNYISLSKSSNECSITIAAKTGFNLKFISFYYYDCSSAPTVNPSVTTYTKESYTWMPSSPTTTVDFVFDASSASIKIWKIYVGYEAALSCDAANLTAANITSNGNQEVGTGITFSKVGSPASGDTWYWQTSATGTDKTYSASSSYTTATTAGSYTVYLRAYNSASDCWGTAASMTNTIYPAPSAMIHNTFAVDAAWNSTIATQDKANITNLNAMAAFGQSVGSGDNKDGLTQKIPSQSSENADKYMSLSFNVAAGKQLNVTSVVFDEQPVSKTGTFKVSISDNQGSATKTQTIASGSAGAPHTLTLDGDIVGSFKGTVTVKVWAYGWSDGYRFGDYFYINGTVEEVETPTYTLTNVVNTNGYGTVSPASVSEIPSGTATSSNSNTYTVNGTTVTATPATNTAQYTYAFSSWSGLPATVTENATVTANFTRTPKNYTLTWNLAGGKVTVAGTGAAVNATGTPNSEVAFGTAITAPTVTKTGYTFNGWNPSVASTMPAEDLTYTAQWREIAQTYTITYNLGPEGEEWKGEKNPLPTYTTGTVHTLPTIDNLTNVNHGEFQGWYESADFQGNKVTTIPADATGDKTYYAKWVYDIQFFEVVDETTDVQNKEFKKQLTDASYPTTYTYGKGITLPEPPAKDGYTEAGWYSQWCVCSQETNGLGWVDACKLTALDNEAYGDVNFAVKYTANTYTITWNANGGNVTPASSTYTYGGEIVTLPTPTRDDYTFNGWFTEESGGTQITEIGTTNKPTSNVIYYAQWTENAPVTPPTQGGEVTAMWPMVDGSDVSLVGNATHASITLSNASKNGELITIEGTQTASYTDYTKRMAIVKVSSNLNDKNESINEDNYIKYTLTVAQGYTFTPTGFSAKIGRQGTDNGSAQVVLKKGNTTLGSTEISQPSRHSTSVLISVFEKTIDNASACVASETIDLYVYFGGKIGGRNFLISEVNIYGTYAPATDEPEPDNCGISECGNATLTYTINASTETTNTADNLLSSATASNTAALEVNDNAVFSTITASGVGRAAEANECFNPAPVMSSKISMPGERNSYNADNYIQFTFTVKDGYAFTPCDIQFVVQPVNSNANFRWAITDGATEYGSGTATNVPLGLGNGATVLTGITSPAKMIVGTYYIRLYPYDDNFKYNDDSYSNNSFRISNDVILKGTVEADNTPRYTVTFNANGHGTAPAAQTVAENATASQPTAPTATGYTFGGWYKEAGCTNAYDFNTEVTSDITLYAKWTAKQYNITYKDKDNSTFSGTHGANYPTKHTYGTATTLVEPTKDGYTFEGWFTTSACTGDAVTSLGATAYTADITLYAKWEVVDDCAAETIYSFSSAAEFTNGWDIVKTNNAYEVAIKTSAYEGIPLTNGGMLGVGIKDQSGSVTITTKESFTNISKITMKLASTDTGNPTFAVYVVNGNTDTKIFQTTPKEANVVEAKSNKDWGTHSASVSNLSGKIKIVFNSSSSGKYATIDDLIICGTSAQTYNVTYKANGGTGDDVTSKVAVVGACPNSFTAPTGTTFKGWNTAADGTGTAYAVGAEVQSDLTLYAQWGVAYTVTYNANGATSGTAPKDNNKYFSGDQVSVLGNISNMTKTNHSFQGWATTANGEVAYAAGSKMTMPADNVTLYAVWNNEKCGENYVTWTLPTNNGAFTSFSTTQNGLTATASPTNSDVTVASDAKEDLTTKLIPTAETSYLEFKFAVPDNKQFTPCELTLPVQPITSACNFTITVTDGTNTLTRTFTNCAHGSITTLTMNNTSTITFTGDVSIKIYSTGTTHGYRLGSPLTIFGAVVDVQNPCTTPVLPTLAAITVCEGENVLWNAAITNELADGETVEYKWVKSPNTSTILATTAQYQIANATEAATGTYIVSATVSAEGKNRTIAHTQVRLTVTPTTATPTITADKDKVYAGNSVTLTAATASTGVTYQWYTCNADGSNEQEIGDATAATYTIASAGDAGTHYYKVRVSGDGTHSCGTAEAIFPLVVSSSNSGQTTCAEIAGQFASGVYNLDTDFVLYGVNNKGNLDTRVSSTQGTSRCGGEKGWFLNRQRFAVTFPVNVVSFSFMGYQSNDRTIENVKTTAELLSEDTEYQTIKYTSTVTKENNCQTFVVTPENTITAGTIVWIDLSNALNISEICYVPYSNVACTDPDVTATVDNATICEGDNESTVTFTATGAADGTTFQWQKKNGSTWEPISEATNATYTINPVAAANTGKYRVIAKAGCNRISNELTLNVLTPPAFGTITTTTRSVMQTTSLVIDDVEATGATSYAWYKSADATFNREEDTQIGTAKALTINSVTEAVGDNAFYLFCVATNSCGSIPSSAIAVNVTALVEEECATKGNEGSADFFTFVNTGCGNKEVDSKKVWSTNSRNKYLTYTIIEGKYFETAKVQIAHSESKKAAYAYSTDGGTNWTYVEIPELSASLDTYTITFLANVNAFRIGRNLQDGNEKDWGVTTGTFYLAEACFTYKNACTATTLTPSNASPTYTMGGDADFTEPTFTLKAGETTLTPDNGAITYSSSNTAIATVESDGNVHFEGMTGNVTITATYAGGTIGGTEYCECTGSYTITVSCDGEEAPKIVAATGTKLDGCNNSITLEAKMQDGTTDFESGSYQWYRNGVAIDGATAKAYTATQSGTYTVVHYGKCDQWSTNKAVITNDKSEPSVERLAPFQYYHVDKTYSDQMKDRHLFAVKSYGRLDNGKRYQLSATRNGSPWDISTSTSFFVITSADNAVDTIMLDLNQMKGKFTEGDNIVITCNPVNSCNALSTISESITIKVIDQTPTLALICSGAKADGSGTRTTDQMTVGGDFLTGYNPADLCQQTENRAFDATKEWGFYTVLKENYIVVPVNGYATFNKLNYEPFDILLLTDYPKTGHSEAAQKIIDDMSDLCDYRPLLSFKTHFQSTNFVTETGEFKYNKWTKKGFTTAPVVPAQPALYADIVCYAHPMFEAISDVTASEDFYHNADDHDQLVYKILFQAGHEGSKGMQGFELADAANFVTIGLIHNDASAAEVTHDNHEHVKWTSGANDRQLVAIAERQANIEARMILFSINCGAQSMQTEGGRQVILQCLKYLYDPEVTDPELIVPADCHLTFDNKTGDGKWSTAANWAPGYKVCPTANSDVRIAAPCTVDIADAEALSVQIVEGGSLTIGQGAALNVTGPITRFDKATSTSSATESEDIFIGSTATGNGTLIFNNDAGNTKATVQMYSTADADTEGYSAAKSTWQYIGTPHSDVQNAVTNYYNSWLYQYDTGKEGWVVIPNGGPLEPFKGYCITHPETPHTYTMTGTLVTTMSQSIDIPAEKYVVVANSWTAPIQVANFADADLENITDKTVYLFNTGSDPEGDNDITTPETEESTSRYAANTYVAMPIHAAPYIGCSTIPSMQGFYVVGGETDGQLHLDYDQLVRPQTGQSIVGEPMHAPARRVAADNEPQVAKFLFRGTRYDDRLIILERPDFTRGYDSGWDGEQWGGNAAAPMSYVVTETRWDAVSAIPEYEGTVIAFRAGEDSEYTIHFDYDGMEDALYLLDTDTQIYTRVLKGNSYTFTCADKVEHNRFILTRKAPQIATGTDHINTGENAKAVKFIKDDKIFIFVNGMLYDATGKMVIR